jgi:hypothetical protein
MYKELQMYNYFEYQRYKKRKKLHYFFISIWFTVNKKLFFLKQANLSEKLDN